MSKNGVWKRRLNAKENALFSSTPGAQYPTVRNAHSNRYKRGKIPKTLQITSHPKSHVKVLHKINAFVICISTFHAKRWINLTLQKYIDTLESNPTWWTITGGLSTRSKKIKIK